MEENKILEKLWSEAQSVEVPSELAPERMRERLESEKKTVIVKNTSERKRKHFQWHGYGGRVAAAAIVLVASLGAFGVANSQTVVPISQNSQNITDIQVVQSAQKDEVHVQTEDGAAADIQASEPVVEDVVVKKLGDYRLADSYEEVGEMLSELMSSRKVYMYDLTDGVAAEDAMSGEEEVTKKEFAADFSESNTNDRQSAEKEEYSSTNLQVTGVDESDIVKTDGHYIYIASGDRVQIVDVSTGIPRQLPSITPEFSGNMDSIREMYVADGRLMLIVQTEKMDSLQNESDVSGDVTYQEKSMMCDKGFFYHTQICTEILTYDITSPARAKLMGTFRQDGSYNTSRKIGDRIYLFTDYGYPVMYPYMRDMQEDEAGQTQLSYIEIQEKLPKIQGKTVPENCIYLPKDGCENGVLIAAMDVKEPEKVMDQKLIFSGYSTMYVTRESVILYRADYSMSSDRACTKLTRFAIGGGKIIADCAEAVPGYIQDTFAIHENGDGYVYVLTTDYTQNGNTNQLYVLDQKLKIHGTIEHIADGESVYAARFVDDIGYFVTYRNMDPLFTVDFSDPANPKLIGELEIPGFSDYLQFWDDSHLIGVGEERTGENSEFVGIKVSLYDISDPTNVKESAKAVMKDACYAPAQYNYKALLADSGKNVIAFLTADKGENCKVSERIFTVQDGELKMADADTLSEDELSYYGADDYRNLYIGDRLYLVREGMVIVYDMTNSFEKIVTCMLTK